MIVVAIDGPAGSGKSTVARLLAERLDVPHVDTGAYYRAATLAVLRAGVDIDDEDAVAKVVESVAIDRSGGRTMLDGRDVEDEVRGEQVTANVSAVSRHHRVRALLLSAQQAGVARTGGVVEGRDAATRVVPDATLKVWLDADVAERARRRALQAGEPQRLDFHRQDLDRRDRADSAQMTRAEDAVVVDTTGMTLRAVVEHVATMAEQAERANPQRAD